MASFRERQCGRLVALFTKWGRHPMDADDARLYVDFYGPRRIGRVMDLLRRSHDAGFMDRCMDDVRFDYTMAYSGFDGRGDYDRAAMLLRMFAGRDIHLYDYMDADDEARILFSFSLGFDWMARMISTFLDAVRDDDLTGVMDAANESSGGYNYRHGSAPRLVALMLSSVIAGETGRESATIPVPSRYRGPRPDPVRTGRGLESAVRSFLEGDSTMKGLDMFKSPVVYGRWRDAVAADRRLPLCVSTLEGLADIGYMWVRDTGGSVDYRTLTGMMEGDDGSRDWRTASNWLLRLSLSAPGHLYEIGMPGAHPLGGLSIPATFACLDALDVIMLAWGVDPLHPSLIQSDVPRLSMRGLAGVLPMLGEGIPKDMLAQNPAVYARDE